MSEDAVILPPRPLACSQCRMKRVKCDHEMPLCGPCKRSSLACHWPEGRKKKRTKRDIESSREPSEVQNSQPNAFNETDWLDLIGLNTSTNYIWPPVFSMGMGSMGFDTPLGAGLGGDLSLVSAPAAHAGATGGRGPPGGGPSDQSGGLVMDERIMSALQNQSAIIHEAADGELELYYYRFPGINRINLRLHRTLPDPIGGTHMASLFDAEGMPVPHIRQPLFESFYLNLSSHFPAISRQRMVERFDSQTMSQFLANSICALGARVAGEQESNSDAFIAKAHTFVLPHTQLPTTEAVSALMLLAWACYGQGNESGFWQFTGMAIRMGLDIGLHQESEIYDSPQHLRRARLLFWTLFSIDRLISFGTGRPASIAEEIVEIPLPIDKDMYPIAARDTGDWDVEAVEPIPFVYFTRLMVIVGRISNLLNGRRGKPRTLATTTDSLSLTERLSELQIILIQFFATLPDTLRWTPGNFQHQTNRGHSGMFLALHLWAHAVLALTYHPELMKSPSGYDTPLTAGMNRNVKLAMSSAKQIAECVVFADLMSDTSYTSTPQLVQPIFVACMALIHEMREETSSGTDGTDLYFRSMARENYSTLIKALCRMATRWKAVMSVVDLLEKRSGIPRPVDAPTGPNFISAPDTGLLRRFTAHKDHPHNIAQPTESSLRESIDRANNAGSALPLSNLLQGYAVGDMSFAPVGLAELEELLGI